MAGIGFNVGLKALFGSQVGLDTVGHNISNAGVEGYSRQNVLFGTSPGQNVHGLLIGSGIDAQSVQRSFDGVLERRIHTRLGMGGAFDARSAAYSQIEAMFAEPNGFGVGAALDGFFSGISALAGSPGDSVLRTGLVQGAADLASSFNQLASNLGELRFDVDQEVASDVQRINELAAEVSNLNQQIGETEATGAGANDLRDARGRALTDLSKLVSIKVNEDPKGIVTVSVSGATLVGKQGSYKLSAKVLPGQDPVVTIQGVTGRLDVSGGSLGANLEVSAQGIPKVGAELDAMARELIYRLNSVHSTGVPAGGPFTKLTSTNALADSDGDGKFEDELLNNGSLPFPVKAGTLYVTVTDLDTGDLVKHQVEVDPKKDTLGDLAERLSDIPHLNAQISGLGSLALTTSLGYGFDFSPALDGDPDGVGGFGGTTASLGTSGTGPFALADGDTLDLLVDLSGVPTPLSIGFGLGDFADITEATADELAAVINADPGAQALGVVAEVAGGHLFLQTAGEGPDQSFQVTGGAAVAALGWTGVVGATVAGSDYAVQPTISGSFEGSANGVYSFVPTGDGTIGTTPGLGVSVYDQDGLLVATLDVGEGYVPGTPLAVAEGVEVSFGLGELSASHNDYFELDVVADADTSDVLVALGLNGLFTGSSAQDIAVREDIALDPGQLAGAFSHAESDGGALLAMFELKDAAWSQLDGETFDDFYGQFVGRVGFEAASSNAAFASNEALLGSLELQREQVSGVNVDEELVNLMKYEQSYQAAVKYIAAVDELNQSILQLI